MQVVNKILLPLKKDAFVIVYLQLAMLLLIAVFCGYYAGRNAVFSAVCGGIAWILPTAFFVRKVFKSSKPRSTQQVAGDFLRAEMWKLFLSAVLVVLFLKTNTVVVLPFLVAYIAVVFVAFFMPLIYELKKVK